MTILKDLEAARDALEESERIRKLGMEPDVHWDSLRDARRESIAKTEAALSRLRARLEQVDAEPVAVLSEDWTPCVKLPVTVHVRAQRPGEKHVSTREGLTPLKADDLIMRGIQGEEYPIGAEIFNRTYVLGEASPTPAAAPAVDVDAVMALADNYALKHGWRIRNQATLDEVSDARAALRMHLTGGK